MLERINYQEEKGNPDLKIPFVIQSAIDALNNAKNSLEKTRLNLNLEREKSSQYYSSEVLNVRVNQTSSIPVNGTVKEIDSEMKSITQELDYVQETTQRYLNLREQVKRCNARLLGMITRAANEYCKHCNDKLLINIKKLSSPAPLLFACQIFADFVEIEFNDLSELACTARQIKNTALGVVTDIFNKRIKTVTEELKKIRTPGEIEKEIQHALNCVLIEMNSMLRQFSKTELQYTFSKEGLNGVILVSKKNQETEAELRVLEVEFQDLINKYKPQGMPKRGVFLTSKDTHPLTLKIKNVEECVQKGRFLIQVYDQCHEELEAQSTQEYDKISKELIQYKEKLTPLCDDLKRALSDLKNKLDNRSAAVSYPAYIRFVQALGNMNVIKLASYQMAIAHQMNELQLRFNAKIHSAKKNEIYLVFAEYDGIIRDALSQASHFTATRERELLSLEKEKLAGDLLETIRLVLLSNLSFWRKQLYGGMSSQKIKKVKVPTGIGNMIKTLDTENSNLETLEELKKIADERLNVNSIRFCFFHVRIDSTSRFYHAFESLSDIKNLNEIQITAFKKALHVLESKLNTKLIVEDEKSSASLSLI